MSGLETYLYNDIIHDNNTALVRKNSGENDNLNQNGILNLYKVWCLYFTCETLKYDKHFCYYKTSTIPYSIFNQPKFKINGNV